MVGIKGKWDVHLLTIVVDELQPMCVGVTASGAWLGTPAPTSTFAGSSTTTEGSQQLTLLCPSGSAVSGFMGQSGIYVDEFQIGCTPIGEHGQLTGSDNFLASSMGGDDFRLLDPVFGPYDCPSNKPGKGLTGRAHDWIDQLALVCNYPSVPPPWASSISLSPSSIVGGSPVAGQLTLNATAPSGGTSVGVSIQVAATDVTRIPSGPVVPNPVVVAAGSTRASFSFSTLPVTSSVPVALNVGTPEKIVTASFTVVPPSLTTVALSANRVTSGASVTGTLSLNGASPSGGLLVNLTSSVPAAATVPATVSIAQGQRSTSFPVTVGSTRTGACAVLTATGGFAAPGSSTLHQTALAILPPLNSTFTLSVAGQSAAGATATITLPVAATAQHVYSLTSSNAVLLGVPTTATIAAGATSITFPITVLGTPPAGASCAVINATDRSGNTSALVFELAGTVLKRIG